MLKKVTIFSIVPAVDFKPGMSITPVSPWDVKQQPSVGLVISTNETTATVLWTPTNEEQEKYLRSLSIAAIAMSTKNLVTS